MPIRRINPDQAANPELVNDLAEEIRRNQAEGPLDAPDITEKVMPYSDNIAVTVIWDKWLGIVPEMRGRIILDAYQEARGRDEMRKISVALGLTHCEAERVGVSSI